jgi:multiple antibiotic resistance protein
MIGSGSAAPSNGAEAEHDVAIFSLAVPSIASPGSILAAVVLTDNREFSIVEQAISSFLLLMVLGITLILLLQANRIDKFIGSAGSTLMVRVLGLILAALAVEMILESVGELLIEMRAV